MTTSNPSQNPIPGFPVPGTISILQSTIHYVNMPPFSQGLPNDIVKDGHSPACIMGALPRTPSRKEKCP